MNIIGPNSRHRLKQSTKNTCDVYGSASLWARPSAARPRCCCWVHIGRQKVWSRDITVTWKTQASSQAAYNFQDGRHDLYVRAFTVRRSTTLLTTSGRRRLQLPFNLRLRSNSSGRLFGYLIQRPPPGTSLMQGLDLACGTVYLPPSHQQVRWPSWKNN